MAAPLYTPVSYTHLNGKFVTLEEEDPHMKAGREEAFSWFIRESWNFRPVGKEMCIRDRLRVRFPQGT